MEMSQSLKLKLLLKGLRTMSLGTGLDNLELIWIQRLGLGTRRLELSVIILSLLLHLDFRKLLNQDWSEKPVPVTVTIWRRK